MSTRVQTPQAKDQARTERLAALNLMEDAMAARREMERANAVLRASEARQAFLLKFSDVIRSLDQPLEIQQVGLRMLGLQLQATRAYYFRAEPKGDGAWRHTIEAGYVRDSGSASQAGSPSLPDFGRGLFEGAEHGRVVAIGDVTQVPTLTPAEIENYRGLEMVAFLHVPLIKDGKFVAGLGVYDAVPRAWQPEEIVLLQEVAERLWTTLARTRAEEARRESEERYRTLFNSIDEAFCTVEVLFNDEGSACDYRFLQVNPSFERQTGLTQVVGRTALELVPQLEPGWFQIYGRVVATGEPIRFEDHAQGLNRWFDVYAFSVGEPRLRRLGILFNDITARRSVEVQVRESEERFRAFVTTTSDAVYTMSADWREMRSLVGNNFIADTNQPSGSWLESYIYPEDQRLVLREIDAVITAKSTFDLEHRVVRVDGSPGWTRSRAIPLFGETGEVTGWFGTAQDITERKRAEEQVAADLAGTQQLQHISSSLIEEDNIDALYARVLEAARVLMRADGANLQRLMPAENQLLLLAHHGFTPDLAQRLEWVSAARETSCGRAMASAERVIIPDIESWAFTNGSEDLEHYRLSGFRSMQSTRLVSRHGQLVGMLSTYWLEPHVPTERELRFFGVLARQVADLLEKRTGEEALCVAQAALRASDERLRGALSISTVGVLFWRECRLAEVNEAFLRMNGFARAEVLGRTWEELTPPEFHEVARHSLEELETQGESTPFEKQSYCRDGTRHWGLFTGRVVGDEVVEFVIDVTDRRRAEQAVHESEHRLRTLADAVPQIIWTNSSEGVADYFNLRWYEYSGLTFEQSVGLGWEAIVHPEDEPRSLPVWRHAQAAGVIFDTEYRLRGADGEYRWFIGRNVPTHNREGRVTGWFGTATDIHDWKRAEQAWRVSEERFRIALEAAEMAAWDYDVRTGTVIWNEQHFLLLGLEPRKETVTPEYFMSFVHPEDYQMVSQRLAEAAWTSGTYRAEFRMIRADNQEVRWMSGFGKAIASAEGHATRMSGVMLDTTERHEAEEALAATQERLRLIVESAHEHAIISMDTERRVESWNPGAEAILGYTREEMLGQSADVFFTPEDLAQDLPQQEANLAVAEGRAGDNRWHRRKDGSRFWANGALLPMRKQPGGPVVGLVKILRDETPAREAEQEKERHRQEIWAALQETERARADAEKNRALAEAAGAAKDHFLAVLSHELRTPLTPVAMAAQSLARRKDLPEPVREALTMIRRNILLESRLVDDLLDVTKIERGKMELMRAPLEMHEVIRHAAETTRSDLEDKSQQLTLHLAAAAEHLEGDADRLQQVLWNLLRNASKFTPVGGHVQIRSWNVDGFFLVAVTDSGIGLEAEALPKIFGAFAQASVLITRQFGGLGLGLAIAQAIVHAHHGELRVASEGPGRGATFTVLLPLSPREGSTGSSSE